MDIPILTYHKVDDKLEYGINTVSPRSFEKQIKFLVDNGFHSFSFSDYLTNRFNGKKPIIITFDDAYQSVFEHAFPILQKYGFTATIFVISDYVGKKNSWDVNFGGKTYWHLDWNELDHLVRSGWEIGSHTRTHPDLTRLTYNKLVYELTFSKEKLEQKLATPVNLISYPFSKFNFSVIEVVKNIYYGGCCLAANNSIPLNLSRFTIPRLGVYLLDYFFWFKLKLRHRTISRIDSIKQKIICSCSRGSIYYTQLKKYKKNLAI